MTAGACCSSRSDRFNTCFNWDGNTPLSLISLIAQSDRSLTNLSNSPHTRFPLSFSLIHLSRLFRSFRLMGVPFQDGKAFTINTKISGWGKTTFVINDDRCIGDDVNKWSSLCQCICIIQTLHVFASMQLSSYLHFLLTTNCVSNCDVHFIYSLYTRNTSITLGTKNFCRIYELRTGKQLQKSSCETRKKRTTP